MSKTYQNATSLLTERGKQLIESYHPALEEVGVKIDYIWALAASGNAITHAGYPAAGLCRIVPMKDRAMGRGDVEILLDKGLWDTITDEQRDALLDHEITHILIVEDEDSGATLFDGIGRPKLKIKKHDYQFGWFTEIVERWGKNSFEFQQADKLMKKDGQLYFHGFLPGLKVVKEARTTKKKGKAA